MQSLVKIFFFRISSLVFADGVRWLRVRTSSVHWGSLRQSVKRLWWVSAPLTLRPWLLTGEILPSLGGWSVPATGGGVSISWGLVHDRQKTGAWDWQAGRCGICGYAVNPRPIFTWVMTESTWSWIQVSVMSLLCRVAGCPLQSKLITEGREDGWMEKENPQFDCLFYFKYTAFIVLKNKLQIT